MQATVRMALVNQFKERLKEGSAVTLEGYILGEIQPKFRMVKKALRLSFLSSTKVEPCPDFSGSFYDVIGHVTACEDLDMYDKNGKSGKKKPLTLVDHEGNKLQCTLWSAFAQEFNDFLNTCADHGKIILVLQLVMMKIWDGKMCVQNGYNATKLFLFDATQPIVEEEFQDVKEYSSMLLAREDVEMLENTATRISANSKNSTKETFIGKNPPRNIVELLDVAQGVTSVIVGTIIAIHEEEGWWYIDCRSCKKKVIREKEIIDLETDMPKKSVSGKDDWWCTKYNVVPTIKTMFRLQVRVQDETGTMSLTLWNDEVQAVVDSSAYQLCEKYAKYAFKVSIDEYNVMKLLPVFTVLRLSDDPEILASIQLSMDTEATSSALPNIILLDLESKTDENTTPVSTQKNNVVDHVEQQHASDGKNKRAAKNDIGNESSNAKKATEVKTKKDA
ncbi:replication protein A 70 kDa DNA-binding subunit B [Tanacetum coccineum]|uniref:Replication protein A 70 kDa DNA-binding subunit B n=1 Tax=Tanacetum coccineum TaxID=301880 RepID=A0ABQ5FWE1_9ASTR